MIASIIDDSRCGVSDVAFHTATLTGFLVLPADIRVSPWPSCLKIRRWLGSLVYVRAIGPSYRPSHGAHQHGPTQPTT